MCASTLPEKETVFGVSRHIKTHCQDDSIGKSKARISRLTKNGTRARVRGKGKLNENSFCRSRQFDWKERNRSVGPWVANPFDFPKGNRDSEFQVGDS